MKASARSWKNASRTIETPDERSGGGAGDQRQARVAHPIRHRSVVHGDVVVADQLQREGVDRRRDAAAAIRNDAVCRPGADAFDRGRDFVGAAER